MKIAVACDGENVSEHFGYCQCFLLFKTENGSLTTGGVIDNPGHQPGLLPRLLSDEKVNVVVAGGMGSKAMELFASQGIDVVVGATGNARDAAKDFLEGKLPSGQSTCNHK